MQYYVSKWKREHVAALPFRSDDDLKNHLEQLPGMVSRLQKNHSGSPMIEFRKFQIKAISAEITKRSQEGGLPCGL